MAATHTPELDSRLEQIASTFRRTEKDDYLSCVWSDVFAAEDVVCDTDTAVKRANEMREYAEYIWNRNGGDFSNF
jgi:hypothetical protein